jgi:disulfide oxidoreductase YuzD
MLIKNKYPKAEFHICYGMDLIEDKDFFLNFIKQITNTEVKTFPIIFYDKEFIGGYSETIHFVDELILAFDIPF